METVQNSSIQTSVYRDLPLSQLQESPFNPRKRFQQTSLEELAQSICAQGVLAPLLVREIESERFEIVAGSRRFRASQIARVAREQGIDQERLRRWVSFLALCGVLERAMHEGLLASYYLKGGVAMELRFAQRARATKDLDLGLEGTCTSRLQALSEALQLGFDDFTFRLKAETRHMEQADTIRVQVAIQFRTRSWQTVAVDLGPGNPNQIDFIDPRIEGLAELVSSPRRLFDG